MSFVYIGLRKSCQGYISSIAVSGILLLLGNQILFWSGVSNATAVWLFSSENSEQVPNLLLCNDAIENSDVEKKLILRVLQ